MALLGEWRKELLQKLDIFRFDLCKLLPLAEPLIELKVPLLEISTQVNISELLFIATFILLPLLLLFF